MMASARTVAATLSSLLLLGWFVYTLNYLNQLPTMIATQAHTKYSTVFEKEYVGLSESLPAELVEKCFEATNISRGAPVQMLQEAKANAEYLFQEFRKVIPEMSLDGYGSHCWREYYSVQWNQSHYGGHIGNIPFRGRMADIDIRKDHMDLLKKFPHGYQSKIACLPKVFMIGYFKCGSSFTYNLIHKLISLSLSYSLRSPPLQKTSFKKEPIFWVQPYYSNSVILYNVPTSSSLGKYLFYFIPGIHQVFQEHRKEAILIDGKTNKMFRWPKFTSSQFNASNYCILPAVLPTLIPNSKYLVIMREPVSFLYSAFWHSCTMTGATISIDLQLKGPDLFHRRVIKKISMFNQCMRDSSTPSLSQACELQHNYSSCILQRLHLLDMCAQRINRNYHFLQEPMKCGHARIFTALFFVHARKWLSILPRDQIHFMFLEDWTAHLTESARSVLQFLDLDASITRNSAVVKKAAKSCSQNPQTIVDYKNDHRLVMRQDTRSLLKTFFKPFNLMLSQLIEQQIPWQL